MLHHSFLLVDVGNTRTKWAVAERFSSSPVRTLVAKDMRLKPKGEMPTGELTSSVVRELKNAHEGHYLVLSSVVPRVVPFFSTAFKRGFHVINAESNQLGLKFDYPNPAEIGADRLVAAVAAHAYGLFPTIIVACGTATAFTVLDANGRLCGGAIAPGLEAQLMALLGATAQLPETQLRKPRSALAKSTQEAVRAGVMLNYQGGIQEIIRQLSATFPSDLSPQIFLTGGNARHLVEHLEVPFKLRPLLVFEGLLIIGARLFTPPL